ncbi:tetratricopeptide repeat protein [Fodinicurvata sediminis]|uniref:tetratricopeptide repeat protein n=1 Tax=Fodinicurvata sediminis TaxID=1121832 RepID=UPI0003B63F5C|nr:tetratricopeptide repeat protein [Fodinicurvata sediminis]
MSDIFREVDEEVRRDQWMTFFKKYGVYIGLAVAVVVLAVAGTEGWKYWQQQQRAESSQRYFVASQGVEAEEDPTAAIEAFEKIATGGEGAYSILAAFQQAGLQADSGNPEQAAATLEEVAGSSAPQLWRDAALVQAAQYRLDLGDYQRAEDMLTEQVQGDGAYRPLALEVTALAAIERGDEEQAREDLQAIVDDSGAPGPLRQRATQMLATIAE